MATSMSNQRKIAAAYIVIQNKCFNDQNYTHELDKRNGILPMLKRNLTVKNAPQRWQDNSADGCFDIVMTFEERVFDMVMEGSLTLLSLSLSLFVVYFKIYPALKHLCKE
jgi:Ssu72-like protein